MKPDQVDKAREMAQFTTVRVQDLHYGLTAPCSDCPYRRNSPAHEGIAKNLPFVISQLMTDQAVAHSCHKTDPRADGFKPGYEGDVQHCAGFLYTMRGKAVAFQEAVAQGRAVDRFKDGHPDCFRNLREMTDFYVEFVKGLKGRRA